MSNAYLGGPSDDAAEAQLATQAQEVAGDLSDGAQNMLLHIARVRPLPRPFPSEALGIFHLRELMAADLIARVSETRFKPTDLGSAVANCIAKAVGPESNDAI